MKRKLALFLIITVLIIAGAVFLVWAVRSGKIKFSAQSNNQITNQATATFKDTSGQTFTVQSNTVTTAITSALVGDLNSDGHVNVSDFAIMKGNWEPVNGTIADLNSDGHVNVSDFAIMKGNWTG